MLKKQKESLTDVKEHKLPKQFCAKQKQLQCKHNHDITGRERNSTDKNSDSIVNNGDSSDWGLITRVRRSTKTLTFIVLCFLEQKLYYHTDVYYIVYNLTDELQLAAY